MLLGIVIMGPMPDIDALMVSEDGNLFNLFISFVSRVSDPLFCSHFS